MSAKLSISVYVPSSTPGEYYFEMMSGLSRVVEHFSFEYDAQIVYQIIDVSDDMMVRKSLNVTPELLPEPPFVSASNEYYATVYVEGIKLSVPVNEVPIVVKEVLEKMLMGEGLLAGAPLTELAVA